MSRDQALKAPAQPSQMHQDVIDIVTAACRNGAVDMHRREIQRAYEENVKNKRIGDGPFARVMSEIAAAGWLLRSAKKRPSKVGVDADSLPSPVAGFCYYAPGAGRQADALSAAASVPMASTNFY